MLGTSPRRSPGDNHFALYTSTRFTREENIPDEEKLF